MNCAVTALLVAAAALPAGTALAATHTTTQSATKPTAKAVATKTIKGPVVDMQWGQVQVTIIVKGKKITDLKATGPTERPRSAYINNIAIPYLRQEVLKAKDPRNIYGISGATMTSEAFYQSLLAALAVAHIT